MVNRDEWIEIGALSKKVRRDTQRLKIESQNTVSKKSLRHISDAFNSINEFKNQAEIDMFSDGLRDINVFFGEKEVESIVGLFLEEFKWTGRIGASELYGFYSAWSNQKDFELLTSTAFGKEVSKRYKKIKNNRNYYLAEEDAKG